MAEDPGRITGGVSSGFGVGVVTTEAQLFFNSPTAQFLNFFYGDVVNPANAVLGLASPHGEPPPSLAVGGGLMNAVAPSMPAAPQPIAGIWYGVGLGTVQGMIQQEAAAIVAANAAQLQANLAYAAALQAQATLLAGINAALQGVGPAGLGLPIGIGMASGNAAPAPPPPPPSPPVTTPG